MSEKINVEKVEKELVSALAADRKYSRENDAKIRAITQRVATYDEFRCRVEKWEGLGMLSLRSFPGVQRDCEGISSDATGEERYKRWW